jgi:hypothetical protein
MDPFDIDSDLPVLAGKSWSHCTLATWQAVQDAAEGNACALVWPDEGAFTARGSWRFNEAHKGFEPLLLDRQTGRAMVLCYIALTKVENRDKFQRMTAAGRGQFARLVEFCWKHTRIG